MAQRQISQMGLKSYTNTNRALKFVVGTSVLMGFFFTAPVFVSYSPPLDSQSGSQLRYRYQWIQVPVNRRVLRSIDSYELQLKMMKMTDNEFKAIMAAMVGNDLIERLDLTEVRLSDAQVVYLTDFFSEESGVTDLILADNALKGRILHRWFDILANKDSLVYLDISGNDLRDKDMAMLFDYLAASQHLTFLYMSRNNFTEAAGDLMGKMLSENTSVVDLDISQNRLRGLGAEKFMKGLAKNSSLERLDFSWNGLGKDGAKAVANMLKKNNTLIYLDVSGTRISGASLDLLFPALKKNSTLQRLVVTHNPLLMSDISRFLTELYKWQATGITRVDFGSYQTVEEGMVPLIDLLFWEKNIDIRYGSILTHSDRKQKSEDVITQFRDDPLALVTRLRNDERLKLVKYFGKLDLEEAIEAGTDEIGAESFLNKMRSNRVTYKDLANRIKKAGNHPNDVIRNALEMADIINPRAPLVPRYSIRSDIARRLYIKSRNEGGF